MRNDRFREWRKSNAAKIFFLALSFYFVFGFSNVGYFLPVFYSQTGYSQKDAGVLVAAFYFTSVVMRPLMGGVVPALGFRRLFLAAAVLTVGSSSVIAFAGLNFWLALSARIALGVGSSLFQIGLASFQAIAFEEKGRGRAFSLIMAGGLAPMMTAVPLADWLLNSGLRQTYIMIPLVFCVLASVTVSSIPGLDDTEINGKLRGKGGGGSAFVECLKIPALRIAFFSMFLFSMTDAASAFMAPMTASYGLMASYFLSSNAVVGVCVRLFFSKLLDRYPRWKLSPAIVLAMSLTLIAASIAPTRSGLIVMGVLFGVGMGFGFPLNLALVSDYVPMRLQPQAVSISWFLMGLNFAMVPLYTGLLGSLVGPVSAFRLVAAVILAGSVYLSFLWNKHGRQNMDGAAAEK